MKAITALLLLHSSIAFAQENARGILQASYNTIKSHQSVSYEQYYMFKGCDQPDTLNFYADASLMRTKDKHGVGGLVYVARHDNTYAFYDGDKAYRVDKLQLLKTIVSQTIAYGDGEPDRNADVYSLGGDFYDALVWHEFLKPATFKKNINADLVIRLHDTIIRKKECYEIYTKHMADTNLPADMETTTVFYIYKEDMMPIFIRQWVKNGDTYQYTERQMRSYNFDNVDKDRFSVKQIPERYRVKNQFKEYK